MVISKIEEIKEVLVTESNEIIIAYLVCNDNSNDVKKIQNFCKQQLEDYKVPTKYIYVTELKKNHNNKIIRSINYL
jgi:acyl-coenzyme A synthetase/AMP-(fatty) acid ligase